MPACPACAQENPDIARFCLSCGLSLAPTQRPSEERRVVSVIFVDLVGFTSRAERLDPEDVRSVLSMYYQRVRAEIESFGGVVEKFIGDAVMGLFGARTSYGDDPERAVRSALAVLDGVAELNAEHSGLDLEARVAVNTGEALVSLAPEDGQTMVAGDVVNTASRLQQAAPVNGILVGAETYRATREVITYEDVAPVVAKGKSAPVRAWRVLAAPRQPGERKTADTPMVDRLGELRLLREAWERVVGDSALHVVTVFGPPGIGKSRLGREFERFASGAGGRAVIGRCLPYRDSGAYGAFATQVKGLAGIFDSDPVDIALVKLRTTVDKLLGEAEGGPVAAHLAVLLGFEDADQLVDRESLFFSVRCFVEAVAAEEPLLLVFEDLHWADMALLDLIEFLSTRLRDLPVLVLATARPEILDGRPTWGTSLPSYLALTLAPLASADAVQLAGYLLGPAAEVEREHEANLITLTAEGNPLFLEQLAAALTEHSADRAAALPTTIRGTVTARLDALPSEERALLVNAAVVGRIFWRGALGEADGAMVGRLLGALESRD
ncbi:MAG TPA: adenylate/guanylate cyclase domain-containing protein, partial [Acidimicrobiales bacterium]|nr:adenylate/guanylate cyclase domain-containing protein [Acidimicrobiales bacterium]